jgi:formyltetrahydrofolate deformylase
MELLWRAKRGDLETEVTMVISNHPDLRDSVVHFGVPFHHVPVGPTLRGKVAAEDAMMELMEGRADLIVLARYMQILTPADGSSTFITPSCPPSWARTRIAGHTSAG